MGIQMWGDGADGVNRVDGVVGDVFEENSNESDDLYIGSEEQSDAHCLDYVSDDEELIIVKKTKLCRKGKIIADGGSGEGDGNIDRDGEDLVLEEGGVDSQKYFVDSDYASDEYYNPNSSDGEGGTRFK